MNLQYDREVITLSDISHIVLSDGTSYDIKDEQARSNRFYSVKGTQVLATAHWKGRITADELTDGMMIAYHLPTESGNGTDVTLNLNLNSGTTGAIPVYLYNNERLNTTIPAGSTVLLQYMPIGSSLSNGQPNLDNRWVLMHGLDQSFWRVI